MTPYWTRDRLIWTIRLWTNKHGRPPKQRDWVRATPEHPHHRTVELLFGSWRSGIEAAGLRIHPRGHAPQWTQATIADAMLDWLFQHHRWPTIKDWMVADPRGARPCAERVKAVFGTWNNAKRAAGWEKQESPLETQACSGCGGELGNYTAACKPCWDRRAKRRKRESVEVRLLEAAQRAARRAA